MATPRDTRMQKGKGSLARRSPRPRENSRHHDAMIGVLMQFRVVVRSIRQHYRSVERTCGVSGAQLWALAQVAASPGMKVGDLATELAVHQSTASNIIDKLEVAHLVERRRLEADRRVVRLFPTAKGKAVLRRAPRPLRGMLQQALLDLPTQSLRSLRDNLAMLVDHLQSYDPSATSAPLSDVIRDGALAPVRRPKGSAAAKRQRVARRGPAR